MSSLTYLNCSSNEAVRFAEAFPLLTHLDCTICQNFAPDALRGLTLLQTLICSGCDLQNDQSVFTDLVSLTKLDVSYCHGLADRCFDPLTALQLLNCSGCPDVKPGCFDKFSSLTELHCNGLTSLSAGCFDSLTQLTVLCCSRCPSLPETSFACLRSLKRLVCMDCPLLIQQFCQPDGVNGARLLGLSCVGPSV